MGTEKNTLLVVFTLVSILFVSACHAHLQSDVHQEGLEKQSTTVTESRGKNGMMNNDMMKRILPMLVTPFMWATMMLPMAILGMKFMLIQSIFLGKLAIVFGILNLVRSNLKNKGGLYSHNVYVKSSDQSHRREDQNITEIPEFVSNIDFRRNDTGSYNFTMNR